MNIKIFNFLKENLIRSFNLPKYQKIRDNISKDTVIDQLPWTPARYKKFKDNIESELNLNSDFIGTLEQITHNLSERYLSRFFGEIWKPRTNEFHHTGWALVDLINKQNPKSVLDVGCGYHPFKGRIKNIVGIDPYNNCADFQVDILEYKVKPASHDHILALGSINFNEKKDVEERFKTCVNLLETGGKFYIRANPGIPHVNGPWIDIFPWTFEVVVEFAEKYNLKLLEYKKDTYERLFFVYQKN